jgi:threonine/homoserine/homoserine lactone efflux protein
MFSESIAVLSMIGIVHLVALVSPGPDFAMILRTSVQNGKHYARWAALGLGFGVLFHVTYCLLGFSLLINTVPYLMHIIATIGALYLLFQGYKSIRFAFKTKNQKPHLNIDSAPHHKISIFHALSNGFLTNVLNPKAIAYFVSFFAAATANIQTPALRIAAGAEVFLLTWAWFTFLAQVVSSKYFFHTMKKYHFFINIAIGCAFVVFSISMILFAYFNI